jgi:hypothetical protein
MVLVAYPVAEIEPQQIRIRAGDVSGIETKRYVRWVRLTLDVEDRGKWCGGWDSNPHVLADSSV